MKKTGWMTLAAALMCVGMATAADPQPNTLSDQETRDGWKLLFDGKSMTAWTGLKSDGFPAQGWLIHDGVLTVNPGGAKAGPRGGDIVTRESYSSFELAFEFNLSEAANSGVKYLVDLEASRKSGAGLGMEFQVLDDNKHPDAAKGVNGNRKTASLYDILPVTGAKTLNPPGTWNAARIVVRGPHVEHWLNGVKVLEFERGTDAFRAAVQASKFKSASGFGERKDGPILIQDHQDEVSYRNIKIRVVQGE